MKILVAHNRYQQAGGEDIVFAQETQMLRAAGCDVVQFEVDNDHIRGFAAKVNAARSITCNERSVDSFKAVLKTTQPDVVHIHNFFPTLSPAAVEAAIDSGCPVIVTLHNYRMICPGTYLLRRGKPCEDCIGSSKLPSLLHRCYRGSIIGSASVAVAGNYFKNIARTRTGHVTLIALTRFAKERFVADGFPEQSIVVRGNCIMDPGRGRKTRERRIVYVGRLSPEKGVDTLIAAGAAFDGMIEIVGDGPERRSLEAAASRNVIFSGRLTPSEALDRVKSASAIAIPSRWYEGFPMVVLEAMATETPILASRIGALGEIVGSGGRLLNASRPSDWTAAMRELVASPEKARSMGENGRQLFETQYSQAAGVRSLLSIYNNAMRNSPVV